MQNGAQHVGLVDLFTGRKNHLRAVVAAQSAAVEEVHGTQLLHTNHQTRAKQRSQNNVQPAKWNFQLDAIHEKVKRHLWCEIFVCRLPSMLPRYGEASRAFSAGTHTSGRFFITSTSAMLKPTEDGLHTTSAVISKKAGMNMSCSSSC